MMKHKLVWAGVIIGLPALAATLWKGWWNRA